MQHILVVDDRPDICAVVQMALEESGPYRVSAATEVLQALAFLDQDPPDLLILDAVMPGRHGFRLASDAAGRGIPVMLMTGEPAMNGLLDEVGWSHLRKPFHLPQLLAETRRALQQVEENLRMVRGSLDKLARTTGDLQSLMVNIGGLRRRAGQTLAGAPRHADPGAGNG
ncbi:MAG TPA: response regulator [Stellaceae bacterium]|nr:response regulator [Stellaceae bacterium]